MISDSIIAVTSVLDICMVLIFLIKLFGLKESIKYPIMSTILFSIIGVFFVMIELHYIDNNYIYLHGVDMLLIITVVYSILFLKGIFFSKFTIITVTYCSLATIYNLSYYICAFIMYLENIPYLIINFIVTRLLFSFIVYVILKYKIKSQYNIPCYYWGILILIPALNFCVSFILESSNVSPYKFLFMLIGMFIINVLLYIVFSKVVNDYEDKITYLMDKQYLKLQIQSYEETKKVFKLLNEFKHDLKNHMLCMQIMLKKNQLEELNKYFSQLSSEISSVITRCNTGNKVIDTVIGAKAALADSHGIHLKIEIPKAIKLEMMDFELSAVLSNLLDNAIEASAKISNPEIKVKILPVYNYIMILISNRTDENILLNNPDLKTTKKDKFNHGVGISIVEGIVKKYGGTFSCYMEKGYFNVNIAIPK